ncbi:hypothetical protein [Alicyclobacillus tolerans]|uniref:Uncharacterized protein n=1 Tax=Alicyclobacillus tolerans TaxID=90970 RepID=A0A1M6TQX8_9BACL|nr:hypothetical protein [Alicyclobacillus montanus]SHK59313.1 hypothetical protein SAMN05443507_11747 [Alicyclobacillus montanus]
MSFRRLPVNFSSYLFSDRERLLSSIEYFDIPEHRAKSLRDGTWDTIRAKVKRSCLKYDVDMPDWALTVAVNKSRRCTECGQHFTEIPYITPSGTYCSKDCVPSEEQEQEGFWDYSEFAEKNRAVYRKYNEMVSYDDKDDLSEVVEDLLSWRDWWFDGQELDPDLFFARMGQRLVCDLKALLVMIQDWHPPIVDVPGMVVYWEDMKPQVNDILEELLESELKALYRTNEGGIYTESRQLLIFDTEQDRQRCYDSLMPVIKQYEHLGYEDSAEGCLITDSVTVCPRCQSGLWAGWSQELWFDDKLNQWICEFCSEWE